MTPNAELAEACRGLMERLPATLPGRNIANAEPYLLPFSQKDVDILYAALGHHEYFADRGHHEDADDSPAIIKRLAARVTVGGDRRYQDFDPYQGFSAAEREFAENMDVWTLEQVIVRVMTEIDRRRRKHNGGMKGMAERRLSRQPEQSKRHQPAEEDDL